jgi:hypothetical protein
MAGRYVRGESGKRIRAALAALDLKPLSSATGVAENDGAPVTTTEAQKQPTDGFYTTELAAQAAQ